MKYTQCRPTSQYKSNRFRPISSLWMIQMISYNFSSVRFLWYFAVVEMLVVAWSLQQNINTFQSHCCISTAAKKKQQQQQHNNNNNSNEINYYYYCYLNCTQRNKIKYDDRVHVAIGPFDTQYKRWSTINYYPNAWFHSTAGFWYCYYYIATTIEFY